MIDLKTKYLGLELKHPFMPGASPMVDDLDEVMRLEDAGASAIVMHSLFEEQITAEQTAHGHLDSHAESFGEAVTFQPNPAGFRLGADDYLEQIGKIKKRVSVPVIASLNGTSKGGWTRYAKSMQDAGAAALELNFYFVATDPTKSSEAIENDLVDLTKTVKQAVKIPVAIKLSPFFTSLPNLAAKLEKASANGLVLFNRFYQPDIDVAELKTVRSLRLSDSSELLVRLHGLAILSGRTKMSLAASGGVHTGLDAIKAIMSGAHAVQMVSSLLRNGPDHLRKVREEVVRWMEEFEYESVAQMTGNMSFLKCPDPKALERLNYLEVLNSWRHDRPVA